MQPAVIPLIFRYYNLIPENNWEADLDHLESQIDEKTAAIVLNNPSNPCGSSFSEDHLRNILEIAYRYRIPVIADEIYENLVFPGEKFISTASLNSGVPILICGGIAKRFLVRDGNVRDVMCSTAQKSPFPLNMLNGYTNDFEG